MCFIALLRLPHYMQLAIALNLEGKSCDLNNQWTVGPGAMASRMSILLKLGSCRSPSDNDHAGTSWTGPLFSWSLAPVGVLLTLTMQAPVELGPYSLEIWLSSESFWQWPCRHQLNWTPILLKCGSCRKPFWGWSCRLSTQIIHERAAVRKTATKRVLSGHIRISWQIMKSWRCTCDHEIWKSLSRYVIAQCITIATLKAPIWEALSCVLPRHRTHLKLSWLHWRKEKAFTQVLTKNLCTDGRFDYRL